jgi:ribosomal subunit interface protein
MRHKIEFLHFEPDERVRKLVDELIARLEKLIKDFDQETVFLRAVIEENPVRTLYHVSITLDLPGKTLAAKAEHHDVVRTLRDAFNEIERQVKKFKADLRGEQYWKRHTRREEVRRKKKVESVPTEERKREMPDTIVESKSKAQGGAAQ